MQCLARTFGRRTENDLGCERKFAERFAHDGRGGPAACVERPVEIIKVAGVPARFCMTKECERKHSDPELALRQFGQVYSTPLVPLSGLVKVRTAAMKGW
ncbi:hypothetical protein HYPGJ_20893 [Hyphomicrobium sp. GJ21]|nr:hypothetical protein HYPGJ_20893 [Hyphomicrobium sp. GJ21]